MTVLAIKPALPVRVRLMADDELPKVRSDFSEQYKLSSNTLAKLPWRAYKRDVWPGLHEALNRAEILVADHGGRIAGWIALSRGRRVDTVHWIATRHELKRQRVMAQIFDAAGLRDRIVYTHKGPQRSDQWVAQWLMRRGAVAVVFEPYEKWKV